MKIQQILVQRLVLDANFLYASSSLSNMLPRKFVVLIQSPVIRLSSISWNHLFAGFLTPYLKRFRRSCSARSRPFSTFSLKGPPSVAAGLNYVADSPLGLKWCLGRYGFALSSSSYFSFVSNGLLFCITSKDGISAPMLLVRRHKGSPWPKVYVVG